MITAKWNGAILAQSDDCVVVEGNQYFPAESINNDFFKPSSHSSFCGWKGTAGYYDIEVNGQRNENAAWFYTEPMAGAEHVKGRVAFWKGVQVEQS